MCPLAAGGVGVRMHLLAATCMRHACGLHGPGVARRQASDACQPQQQQRCERPGLQRPLEPHVHDGGPK